MKIDKLLKYHYKRSLYSRGLNLQGQLGLGNRYNSTIKFSEISKMKDQNIQMLSIDHSQNLCLLGDSTLIFWGWPLCTRTTYKMIDLFERFPRFVRLTQKYTPFFKSGYEEPLFEHSFETPIKKISIGSGYLSALDNDGRVYLWGDNYAGQLGTNDDVHREYPEVLFSMLETNIINISCGFQHCLLLEDNGNVYGLGKNDRYQLGSLKKAKDEKGEILDNYGNPTLIKIDESIKDFSAGKFHSIFLSENGNVYACGFNMNGQTGKSKIENLYVKEPLQVRMPDNVKIEQLAAGSHHNIMLGADGNVYGFGARLNGQMDGKNYDGRGEQCVPIKIDIPNTSKIVKIKANNLRSAAFEENGNVWFWGGYFYENSKKLCVNGFNLMNEEEGLPKGAKIVDIGLGFAHDIVMIENEAIVQESAILDL